MFAGFWRSWYGGWGSGGLGAPGSNEVSIVGLVFRGIDFFLAGQSSLLRNFYIVSKGIWGNGLWKLDLNF